MRAVDPEATGESSDGRPSPRGDSKLTLGEVEVTSKGVRCFQAEDAQFFLGQLPGPRDREGLPEPLRFWESRIEEIDPGRTFRVGVVYGPSGSGKSSMIWEGLLLRLDRKVTTVLVERSALWLALFDGELAREPEIEWGDAARGDRPEPARELVAAIKAAESLFALDFGPCQALPIDDFERIARGLDRSGYRLIALLPYRMEERTLVAAVWSRGGRSWGMARGLSPGGIAEADRAHRAEGFLPVDLASVLDPEEAGPGPSPPMTSAALRSSGRSRPGARSRSTPPSTSACRKTGTSRPGHRSTRLASCRSPTS